MCLLLIAFLKGSSLVLFTLSLASPINVYLAPNQTNLLFLKHHPFFPIFAPLRMLYRLPRTSFLSSLHFKISLSPPPWCPLIVLLKSYLALQLLWHFTCPSSRKCTTSNIVLRLFMYNFQFSRFQSQSSWAHVPDLPTYSLYHHQLVSEPQFF